MEVGVGFEDGSFRATETMAEEAAEGFAPEIFPGGFDAEYRLTRDGPRRIGSERAFLGRHDFRSS